MASQQPPSPPRVDSLDSRPMITQPGWLEYPIPDIARDSDIPDGEIAIFGTAIDHSYFIRHIIQVHMTARFDNRPSNAPNMADCLLPTNSKPCILIAPRDQLDTWADNLASPDMNVIILSNSRVDYHTVSSLPTIHPVWRGPGHSANKTLIITHPGKFAQEFGNGRPGPTRVLGGHYFNTMLIVGADDYIGTPMWDDMLLESNRHADWYMAFCTVPPNLTTFLKLMKLVQNPTLASQVDGVDAKRGYTPDIDPYTLGPDHDAAGYCYCVKPFVKWVIENETISKQEYHRRFKDVLGMLVARRILSRRLA